MIRKLLATKLATLLTTLCLLLTATVALGEQRDFGNYEVHYSVFDSTFIQPDVARTYGITRGKDRKILNVAVRKKSGDDTTVAKRALLSGNTSDLIRINQLNFREITEQDAIYYIAEFKVSREDTLRFRLEIQADRDRPPYKLEFTKTLYWDE